MPLERCYTCQRVFKRISQHKCKGPPDFDAEPCPGCGQMYKRLSQHVCKYPGGIGDEHIMSRSILSSSYSEKSNPFARSSDLSCGRWLESSSRTRVYTSHTYTGELTLHDLLFRSNGQRSKTSSAKSSTSQQIGGVESQDEQVIRDLRKTIRTLQEEKDTLETTLDSIRDELKAKETEIVRLKRQLAVKGSMDSTYLDAREQLHTLKQKSEQQEKTVKDLQTKLYEQNNTITQLQDKIKQNAGSAAEIESWKKKWQEQQKSLGAMQNTKKQLEDVMARFLEQEQLVKQMKEQIRQKTKNTEENAALKLQLQNREKALAQLELETKRATLQAETALQELDNVRQENDTLCTKIKMLEEEAIYNDGKLEAYQRSELLRRKTEAAEKKETNRYPENQHFAERIRKLEATNHLYSETIKKLEAQNQRLQCSRVEQLHS